jgi:Ca2+/H+ antiporter, TMEM165/GDT1 family
MKYLIYNSIIYFLLVLLFVNADLNVNSLLSESKKSLTYLNKNEVNDLMKDVKRDGISFSDRSAGNPRDHSDEDDDDSDDSRESKRSKHMKNLTANFGFIHAFFASVSVIVVSEIGDKTFFIAAIMAMKHSRFTVYSGAIFALFLMTLLSALLGNILTKLIPKTYTYYASSILFAIFGLKMLREGWSMSNTDASEEYEEASTTLKESEEKDASLNGKDLETGGSGDQESNMIAYYTRKFTLVCRKYVSTIFLQAFILTFLAEWGDRSQISTIILGARENMVGTVLGGTLGHGLCTGLAVVGGRMIAQRISVRTVTLAGAIVFLFFAFSAFFVDPDAY